MKVKSARRIIARKLNVGVSKIRISPETASKVKEAITGADLGNLVAEKTVYKLKKNSQSMGRARVLKAKKRKGRKRGSGSKRGSYNARVKLRDMWIVRVRSQRKYIKSLLTDKKITKEQYRELYNKVKGGFFRSKGHINIYLEKN